VILEIVLLLSTGVVAGLLAGLLGIGGGLIIVPSLIWLLSHQGASLDVAVPIAVATSLGTMLLTSASAVRSHQRRGAIDWFCARRLAISVTIGALGGAWLAVRLPGPVVARTFAILAGVIGLRMLMQPNLPSGRVRAYPRLWPLAGLMTGAASAMIGIGGGSFIVPYLAGNGYRMVQAVAIASTCGWLLAAAAVFGFVALGLGQSILPWTLGYLYLPGVLLIGLGGALAAPLGVRLAHRLPAALLRRLFGVLLLVLAVKILVYEL